MGGLLRQICKRLGIKVDDKTINDWGCLYRDENWKLYPDAMEAFNSAKALGLKTAIVTSIAKFIYIKPLKPIIDKVDLLVDAFTFQCEKSNPKIYRETLKALNVKPEQAVMVGDEEDVDILIPKRLGMYTIFLDRNRKREPSLLKVKPHAIADNLKETVQIIEKRIKREQW
jgi:putative hydrolase of the HAD superfamily